MAEHAIGIAGTGETITFRNLGFRDCQALTANSRRIYFYGCRFEHCDGVADINPTNIYGILSVVDCEFTDCYSDQSLSLFEASHVTVTNCRYEANATVLASSRDLTCRECEFVDNEGENGVLELSRASVGSADGDIEDCRFAGNQAFALIGASLFHGETDVAVRISGCSFVDNDAICVYSTSTGQLEVEACSFVGNRGDMWPADLCFMADDPGPVSIDRCIFAFRPEGTVLRDFFVTPPLSVVCTDIYGNAEGDWTGPLAPFESINGNFSADPQFCDWPGGDITLFDSSPCLPENNDCGVLIGAEGEGCTATAIAADPAPGPVRLEAAPNPFNPSTRLSIHLERDCSVDLAVFDATGRRVARLLEAVHLTPGRHAVDWRARDEAGRALPSGVYLALLRADGARDEQKLVLLR
jgi:hypothetical protein